MVVERSREFIGIELTAAGIRGRNSTDAADPQAAAHRDSTQVFPAGEGRYANGD